MNKLSKVNFLLLTLLLPINAQANFFDFANRAYQKAKDNPAKTAAAITAASVTGTVAVIATKNLQQSDAYSPEAIYAKTSQYSKTFKSQSKENYRNCFNLLVKNVAEQIFEEKQSQEKCCNDWNQRWNNILTKFDLEPGWHAVDEQVMGRVCMLSIELENLSITQRKCISKEIRQIMACNLGQDDLESEIPPDKPAKKNKREIAKRLAPAGLAIAGTLALGIFFYHKISKKIDSLVQHSDELIFKAEKKAQNIITAGIQDATKTFTPEAKRVLDETIIKAAEEMDIQRVLLRETIDINKICFKKIIQDTVAEETQKLADRSIPNTIIPALTNAIDSYVEKHEIKFGLMSGLTIKPKKK